jgi:hypothetical protein
VFDACLSFETPTARGPDLDAEFGQDQRLQIDAEIRRDMRFQLRHVQAQRPLCRPPVMPMIRCRSAVSGSLTEKLRASRSIAAAAALSNRPDSGPSSAFTRS